MFVVNKKTGNSKNENIQTKGVIMEALKKFILDNLLIVSFNEYEGMEENLSLVELYHLKGIVEGIISSRETTLGESK